MSGKSASHKKRKSSHVVGGEERVKKNSPGAGLPDGGAYPAMGKAGPAKPLPVRVASPNPIKKPRHAPDSARAQARYSGKRGEAATARVDARWNKASKGFQLLSLDDYYVSVMKAEGGAPGAPAPPSGAPAAPGAAAKPKKYPRRLKPTVRMKPISDGEAMARIRSGTYEVAPSYQKKSLRRLAALKALATGYGKTSGGGALKAPNRGGSIDLGLSMDDLRRATEAMALPSGSPKPPKVYLPGVHSPKSPVRQPTGLKKVKKTYPTLNASMRPSTTSAKSPKPVDGGGATELSNSIKDVVNKSGGSTMTTTNFNDIFKSELGIPADEVLVDCPHCEVPITKGDIAKASHGGKGKTTHVTGAKHGKSSAHVRDQNPEGGTMRGGEGRGVHTSSRGVPGAKKHDEPVGVQNSKGSHARKSGDGIEDEDAGDDSAGDAVNKSEHSTELMGNGLVNVKHRPSGTTGTYRKDGTHVHGDYSKAPKSVVQAAAGVTKKSITVRGTEFVQYVDDGSDAAIAKAIAEGTLGGTPPTQPLDMNNDLTRLLV